MQGEEYPQTLRPVQKVSVDLAGVKTREKGFSCYDIEHGTIRLDVTENLTRDW